MYNCIIHHAGPFESLQKIKSNHAWYCGKMIHDIEVKIHPGMEWLQRKAFSAGKSLAPKEEVWP